MQVRACHLLVAQHQLQGDTAVRAALAHGAGNRPRCGRLAGCGLGMSDLRGGQLSAGDKLPPHRELARRLAVDVTTVARGANVSEFLSSSRPNGKNNVQISDQPITANPFAEYSKLSRREGSLLSLVWENSQPSAVFPGMMVKLLYLEEDEIKTTFGVMLKAHHYVSMVGEGMTSERHKTNSALSVFVQKKAI